MEIPNQNKSHLRYCLVFTTIHNKQLKSFQQKINFLANAHFITSTWVRNF